MFNIIRKEGSTWKNHVIKRSDIDDPKSFVGLPILPALGETTDKGPRFKNDDLILSFCVAAYLGENPTSEQKSELEQFLRARILMLQPSPNHKYICRKRVKCGISDSSFVVVHGRGCWTLQSDSTQPVLI